MPTYEYKCNSCGYAFEQEQRMSDPPIKKCPKCGKLQVKRLVGTGNFILKGGGWYADGYGGSGSSSSKASESQSETKPEAPKKDSPKDTKS